MEMDALAEGVKTVEKRDLLVSLGCTRFQGYLFAHPMTGTAFKQWLMARPCQHPTACGVGLAK
ncbi:EAL domain-containing protein [Stenotrophomonas sp. ATCM1_4]|nr:EAL domain-containing protein [Stenotrophomonas sp. ATCM1_4]